MKDFKKIFQQNEMKDFKKIFQQKENILNIIKFNKLNNK
jgi:hypothetical protein